MAKPFPKYSLWEAINTAIALGMRALEEIRTLSRTPGPPGPPGMGFDDLEAVQVNERTVEFRLTRGDETKVIGSFRTNAMLYRGVFGAMKKYECGDVVTWGGSAWIALKETEGKPEQCADWQLAVKRGRDGRETVKIG